MAQQNPFCKAEYDAYNDEYFCQLCEMYWEAGDPIRPACQFEANQQGEQQS